MIIKCISPNGSCDANIWAEAIIPTLTRDSVAIFENFPPEYFYYYQTLQTKLAERFPEEQNRPYIALQIKGKNRLNDGSSVAADVGLAGGTGPLSDAKLLGEMLLEMSHIDQNTISSHGPNGQQMRQIDQKCENLSATLYSIPPPRDSKLALPGYTIAYREVVSTYPCQSMHLLSNTAHLNMELFRKSIVGTSGAVIDDMTRHVAQTIKQDAHENATTPNVLVLGTEVAHNQSLYPTIFKEIKITSVLPQKTSNQDKPEIKLQGIINDVKAGKNIEAAGDAFINFVVDQIKKDSTINTLLFSCTEIPLLLSATNKATGQTIQTKLNTRLAAEFPEKKFEQYDTEKMFAERIIQKHEEIYQPQEKIFSDDDRKNNFFKILLEASKSYTVDPVNRKGYLALKEFTEIVFQEQGDSVKMGAKITNGNNELLKQKIRDYPSICSEVGNVFSDFIADQQYRIIPKNADMNKNQWIDMINNIKQSTDNPDIKITQLTQLLRNANQSNQLRQEKSGFYAFFSQGGNTKDYQQIIQVLKESVRDILKNTKPGELTKAQVGNAEEILETHRGRGLHFLKPSSTDDPHLKKHQDHYKVDKPMIGPVVH